MILVRFSSKFELESFFGLEVALLHHDAGNVVSCLEPNQACSLPPQISSMVRLRKGRDGNGIFPILS